MQGKGVFFFCEQHASISRFGKRLYNEVVFFLFNDYCLEFRDLHGRDSAFRADYAHIPVMDPVVSAMP